jgi:hypothetical protein
MWICRQSILCRWCRRWRLWLGAESFRFIREVPAEFIKLSLASGERVTFFAGAKKVTKETPEKNTISLQPKSAERLSRAKYVSA